MTQFSSSFQTLDWWRLALVDLVRDDQPDLTARQMALLLTVYTTPAPHTVKSLAEVLNISKPAITRAVTRLEELSFVRRKKDEADRRSVLITRTVKGSVFLSDLGEMIVHAGEQTQLGKEMRRPQRTAVA